MILLRIPKEGLLLLFIHFIYKFIAFHYITARDLAQRFYFSGHQPIYQAFSLSLVSSSVHTRYHSPWTPYPLAVKARLSSPPLGSLPLKPFASPSPLRPPLLIRFLLFPSLATSESLKVPASIALVYTHTYLPVHPLSSSLLFSLIFPFSLSSPLLSHLYFQTLSSLPPPPFPAISPTPVPFWFLSRNIHPHSPSRSLLGNTHLSLLSPSTVFPA